jgi:hypothetical protein
MVASLTPMLEDNPGMALDHNVPSLPGYKAQPHHAAWPGPYLALDLPDGQGQYVLHARALTPGRVPAVSLQSPVSGSAHTYTYAAGERRWESEADGHILVELLVRELLRTCRGFPHF